MGKQLKIDKHLCPGLGKEPHIIVQETIYFVSSGPSSIQPHQSSVYMHRLHWSKDILEGCPWLPRRQLLFGSFHVLQLLPIRFTVETCIVLANL